MDPVVAFEQAQARVLQRARVHARSRMLRVESIAGRAHVLTAGEGAPVVLVPGLADPAAMWAPLMAELPGFSLHAVDRPSFGLTSAARHTTVTLRTLAVRFLVDVLDALGIGRAALVANSMGSLWSIWLAIDRPDRVAAMTHVGCPALALGTSAPLPMRLLGVPGIGRLLMKLSPPSRRQVERFARVVGEDLGGEHEIQDLLVATQQLPGVPAALRQLVRSATRLRGAREHLVLHEEDLARIECPVQLVWGGRDAFGGPGVGQRMSDAIGQAELHVIPEAGHLPWIHWPQRVGRLTSRFLHAHVGMQTSAVHG